MGWLWWEAGEGSCCGALDTWGNLLRFQPATPPVTHDQPPTLQAPASLTVVSGSALSFRVNASDPDSPPQNLTLSCINCPTGASFPEISGHARVTGVFTWTPAHAQAGKSYNITFTASDGFQSSNASVIVTVHPPSRPSSGFPPLDSPIALLTVGGTTALAIVAAITLYRRRISRARR
jgi:Putative Ig domain